MVSFYIICHHVFISEIKAIIPITWIFKNTENGFDFHPQMIFQTEIESETWLHQEDFPKATDYDNISFTLTERNWPSFDNFKIWHTLHLVTSSKTCVTHKVHDYTSTPIYLKNIGCGTSPP